MGPTYLHDLKKLLDVSARKALQGIDTLSAADIASLTSACKSANEAEQVTLESTQLVASQRADSVRFWVPIAASFLSVAILGSTLVLQTRQYTASVSQNTHTLEQQRDALNATREANEDTQWREALKLMADKPGQLMNDAASVALLRHFTQSAHVGAQARDFSSFILQYATNPDMFETLLDATVQDRSEDALHRTVKLNRALSALLTTISDDNDRAAALAKKGGRFVTLQRPGEKPQLMPIEDKIRDLDASVSGVADELAITGRSLAQMLAAKVARSPDEFARAYFVKTDLSNLDFSGTDLNETGFTHCTLDGTDFSNAKAANLGNWTHTAWWHAGKMPASLAQALAKSFPYTGHEADFPGITPADYEKDLKRLGAI